ncbi:MAG: thiamine phosphate synthase [Butyricicoccaceae bacterium]
MKSEMRKHLLLYAVTDRAWTGTQTLYEQVEQALAAGVTMVQLREKQLREEEFIREARPIVELCRQHGVPCLINDSIAVCQAVGADGVHVGQSDMAAERARELLGPDAIIGVTAKTTEQAQAAQRAGADYIGTGAAFGSSTKLDATYISAEQMKAVCASVDIPAVAIGGITRENAAQLAGRGIAGIAVVSAIFAQPDIARATAELLAIAKQVTE